MLQQHLQQTVVMEDLEEEEVGMDNVVEWVVQVVDIQEEEEEVLHVDKVLVEDEVLIILEQINQI